MSKSISIREVFNIFVLRGLSSLTTFALNSKVLLLTDEPGRAGKASQANTTFYLPISVFRLLCPRLGDVYSTSRGEQSLQSLPPPEHRCQV